MKHPALFTIQAKLELAVLLFGRDTLRQNPRNRLVTGGKVIKHRHMQICPTNFSLCYGKAVILHLYVKFRVECNVEFLKRLSSGTQL